MDHRDADMEESGKILQDEVMGGEECVDNNQLNAKDVGVEQEKSPNLVKHDIQNPHEIGIAQENPIENAEEGENLTNNTEEGGDISMNIEKDAHPDQSKQVLPVDGAQDTEKVTTATEDGNAHESEKDATGTDDGKAHDNKKNVTAMDSDKILDGEKDANGTDDDVIPDREKDARDMDGDHGVPDEAARDVPMNMPEDKMEGDGSGHEDHQKLATPKNSLVIFTPSKAKDHSAESPKNELEDTQMDEGYESGTQDEQDTFMKEVETFYREKNLEFKPPKFYGQPLNCLKLWRSVIRLGGYDRVTGSKLWRQVGESFHPPKTCTTVSWTFRQFYEKALLEYERFKMQTGELELPLATVLPEASTVESEANGHQTTPVSGRARRDAAARAMQGWHAQRLFGYGEDKNSNSSQKREKSLKSIGSLKQKRPSEVEYPVKAARTETSKQVVTTVADVGPPASWVKINVRETKDSFEVYALVPGLLREEVRVQSDPAGRLVITGQPEQHDNPWGITAFKKVISLPARIDPLRTSAVVSLHGRLFVRVPFEQSSI